MVTIYLFMNKVVPTVVRQHWSHLAIFCVGQVLGGVALFWVVEVGFMHKLICCIPYTQSQKKCTMNSLTSPVNQGRGQVLLAGSYLIMRI